MFAAGGADACFGFRDGGGLGEVLVYLVVEVVAIANYYESPVAGEDAEDFLGEKLHRVAFAAALGMPEDSQAASVLGEVFEGGDRSIDS